MTSPTIQHSKRPRQSSHDEPSPASAASLEQSPASAGVGIAGEDTSRMVMPASGAGTAAAATGAGAGANAGAGRDGSSGAGGTGAVTGSGAGGHGHHAGTNFRNVSACNRCRLRKNRCDQNLPSCDSCTKAKVACVGYDPITKTEIPRSYVYYLENRIETLESILRSHNIMFPPADNLELSSKPNAVAAPSATPNTSTGPHTPMPADILFPDSNKDKEREAKDTDAGGERAATARSHGFSLEAHHKRRRRSSGPGMAGSTGLSTRTRPGAAMSSNVAFAKVVLAAVHHSVTDHGGHGDKPRSATSAAGPPGVTSMRDSFFGIHTKPEVKPAAFPDKELGRRLAQLYFEHANPQIPILHRGEFMHMFELAYSPKAQVRGPRELYMLNMVFAIGCGSIVGDAVKAESTNDDDESRMTLDTPIQAQPEEYHASAIIHLEACLSNNDGLDVLQAMLLLANFALLRPVPPGLWYITGAAMRLAIDLGLYYEDGAREEDAAKSADKGADTDKSKSASASVARGRRHYVRDKRRRLWWCTYALDRLVSTCVGRPFGISDLVVTAEFPSLLDDDFITPHGFTQPPTPNFPSYKRVSYHYFKLRRLQSEILHVLQYNQALLARERSRSGPDSMAATPPVSTSPFLAKFSSFRDWRIDIDTRLWDWRQSAPTKESTGVLFSTEFLELNYWQAVILLYRQSLSVPAMFEGEYNTSKEVNSPTGYPTEQRGDEDRIHLKVAEAGQRTLRLYGQLNMSGLVSYTYLATHHLFMAGISYLYAIWHSPLVRSRLKLEEVDTTILVAKAVFTDMIPKCPPAETCRAAFDRTAKATVKMAMASGGFGPQVTQAHMRQLEQMSRQEGSRDWSPSIPDRPSTSSGGSLSWRHQKHPSSQLGLKFGQSPSDSFSSPTVSPMADPNYSPPLARPMAVDDSAFGSTLHTPQQQQLHLRPDMGQIDMQSPGGLAPSQSSTPLLPSPSMPSNNLPPLQSQGGVGGGGSTSSTPVPGGGNMFGQPTVTTPIDFNDMQGVDLFPSWQGTPTGDEISMAALWDSTVGFNWEGLNQFASNGQQVNLFDGFFSGGPGGGNMGMTMGAGMGMGSVTAPPGQDMMDATMDMGGMGMDMGMGMGMDMNTAGMDASAGLDTAQAYEASGSQNNGGGG